ASYLSQLQRGFSIESIENILNGHFVRLVLGNDGTQLNVDTREPSRQRFTSREFYRPAGQAKKLSGGAHLNHAVARVFAAAINAQDSHVHKVYRGNTTDHR